MLQLARDFFILPFCLKQISIHLTHSGSGTSVLELCQYLTSYTSVILYLKVCDTPNNMKVDRGARKSNVSELQETMSIPFMSWGGPGEEVTRYGPFRIPDDGSDLFKLD